ADNDPKRSNEEAHIDAVWAASRKMTLLHELAINGAIHGSAFLKIQPRPDSKIPRLIALDPAIVTPSWDSDDVHRAWRYRLQWTELERRVARPDVLVRRQVIERDDGGRWSIADYVSRRGGRWEPMGKTIPWNYAWPPIADCQNLPCPNAYWGEADLGDDVLGLNDGLNFSQSNMQRIERYHGHPRLYGYGLQPAPPSPDGEDAGGAADAAIDGIIEFGSQDAFIRAVDAISSLSSHLERYRSLNEALHEIARVPQIATGKLDSIGQLSGLALKILYGPLLAKTATKRILYGDLLAEINARLLELANMDGSLAVANVWPEVLPSDPLTEANAAKIEMELGILSRETAAAQVGLDWDQERAGARRSTGGHSRRADCRATGYAPRGGGTVMADRQRITREEALERLRR